MPSKEQIDQFKEAFKLKARQANKGIRWEKSTKWYHTQTSLAPVAKALDDLAGAYSVENIDAVLNAIGALPQKKKTKYKEALDQLTLEMNRLEVSSEETLTNPPVSKFKRKDGTYGLRDDVGNVLFDNLTENRAGYVHNVLTELEAVKGELGVEVDDLGALLKSIASDPKMGQTSANVDGTIWRDAITELKSNVIPKVKKDLAKLKSSGIIPEGATLEGMKFTGSDFHKGGKQVMILRFKHEGKVKKAVYKPSSLMVDSLLFGEEGVAKAVGGIPTYKIVPGMSEDEVPKDLGYGYMEFVDTQGGPTSADDVLNIYKSIAANMALAWYAGLEDVHHENVMMKKGGLQVIDMEATTGTFKLGEDLKRKGWSDQQWPDAISANVQVELEKAITEGRLEELPARDEVEDAMVEAFKAAVKSVRSGEKAESLKTLEKALAKQRTRIVPIETRAFQAGIIQFARADTYSVGGKDKPASLENWIAFVDEKLEKERESQEKGESSTFIGVAKGSTSTPIGTIRNLLVSPGVWKALRRGDVPYYVRDLGSDKVYDEDNNAIDVPGHAKVGRSIATEMAERRTQEIGQLVEAFVAQGVNWVLTMHDKLALMVG